MKLLPKLKIAGFFLLGLLFTLFTLTIQVNANTDLTQLPFYWDAIDVEIDVRDNGDMLVTETQKLEGGDWFFRLDNNFALGCSCSIIFSCFT